MRVRVPPVPLTKLRLVAQWSEPAPYKGQTTVQFRPGLLNKTKLIKTKHRSSIGEDSALVQRQRRFESGSVLFRSLTIWFALFCAHDVVAAYLLAMQGVSVRSRLGAYFSGCGKVWLIRVFWKHEITGSNPVILTNQTMSGNDLERDALYT